VAACLLAACGSETEVPPSRPATGIVRLTAPGRTPLATRTLALGPEGTAGMVRGCVFRGELALETSGPLNGRYELSFVPIAPGPVSDDASLTLHATMDERTVVLARVALQPVGESDPASLLTARRRVDLSPFAGRALRLRWTATRDGQPLDAGLAQLSLVRTDAPPPPDVLLICSDTHRFDHSLGEDGDALMPNLGSLRSRSVFYRRTWSPSSWTLPSITSVMTGLYPHHHGTGRRLRTARRAEFDGPRPGAFAAPWEDVVHEITTYPGQLETIPEVLELVGYSTALVSANPFYFLSGLADDGHAITVNARGEGADVVNIQAARVLELQPEDRPLFLSVHYMDVHNYGQRLHRRAFADSTLYTMDRERLRAGYQRAVREFDAKLGELLEMWESRSRGPGSMIIFYSDHGEHLADPGSPSLREVMRRRETTLPESYARLAAPILNHGNSLQESLMRVPLLVRFPGDAELAGRIADAPASLVDLLPTVLEAVGLEPPERPEAGRSLLGAGSRPDRELFHGHQLWGEELSGVRRGDLKLVWREDGSVQLRRVCADCPPDGDPGEALEDPDLAAELLASLQAHVAAGERAADGLRSDHRPSAEDVEQLRALGYVE
jgi:arylsulfatase A-like enzyme